MATTTPGIGQLLTDVQILSIGANQTIQSISGQTNTEGTGVVQMTPNSVGLTAPRRNIRWDGTYLAIFPGTLAAGATAPDLKMWVHVDDGDYGQWFYVDMTIGGNMFPRRENEKTGRVVLLGQSMLLAAVAATRGAGVPKNMATVFTGWKIGQGVDFYFTSTVGFTAADFVEPPTIQLYGDVYDSATLGFLQQNMPWVGDFSMQSSRRQLRGLPTYRNTQVPTGGYSLTSWGTYSGGAAQGQVKLQRLFRHAFNNVAVSGNTPFPLTKIDSIGGAVGNVPVSQMDLGFDFTNTRNAFLLREIGRRPGAGAGYFGLFFGGIEISPNDTSLGTVSTTGNPRVPFGNVQPILQDSNLYFAMQDWGKWSPGEPEPEVIADETAAIAIAAQNGQTILANTDETSIGGVLALSGSPRLA